MIPERTTTFISHQTPKDAKHLVLECVKELMSQIVCMRNECNKNHGNNLEITITTRILTDEQLQEEHKTKLKKFQDEIEEPND